MTQDQRPATPSQQDQKQAKGSAQKSVDTAAQNESDPRSELGLKSPAEEAKASSERPGRKQAEGQKATQLDGNPSPRAPSSPPLNGEDDTPMAFGKSKESRNDQ